MARARPTVVCLDTHIICWLFEGRVELLSDKAKQTIEECRLLISPLVDLELHYLFEIGRINKTPKAVITKLVSMLGVRFTYIPTHEMIARARHLVWTRDPFDRMIVADAICSKAGLITKDRLIREKFDGAIW